MLKIAGSILVIFSCTGFGILKSVNYRCRMNALLELKKLLLMLRGEIHYARTPLGEAFAHLSEKMQGEWSTFADRMAVETAQLDGRSFSQIWENCILQELSDSGLTTGDLKQIIWMGDKLGFLDSEMQIATIDLQIEQTEGVLERLEHTAAQKQRIYQCVGAFCGIMVAILLL